MSRRVARLVRALGRALARQDAADRRRLLGRWALPSGAAFAVFHVDRGLVLCGNGAERWYLPAGQMLGLLARGQLRYLGRGR